MKIVAGIEHRLKQLEAMERMLKMSRASVNVNVSDIYFNLDLTNCYNEEEGYDREQLLAEAKWLIDALDRLGVKELPGADDLVDNFLERV